MTDTRRLWSDDDIAKLKSLAGKLPAKEIARKLGRSEGAIQVEASKLRISLRSRPRFGGPRRADTRLLFSHLGRNDVATGTVKWFNSNKGYGFIQPDNGGKDVFVHISAVERAGLSDLREGAKLSYEVVANRGKESAENLRVS
jgi:cold shock protein